MVRDGHQDARWRTHERKGTSNTCAVYRLKASGLHILTKKEKREKAVPISDMKHAHLLLLCTQQ